MIYFTEIRHASSTLDLITCKTCNTIYDIGEIHICIPVIIQEAIEAAASNGPSNRI